MKNKGRGMVGGARLFRSFTQISKILGLALLGRLRRVAVVGSSMTPIFEDGDHVFMGVGLALRAGDVIAFRDPMRPDLKDPPLLIKRVKHFCAEGGCANPRRDGVQSVVTICVAGDGEQSIDSRHFGPIRTDAVYARRVDRLDVRRSVK